MKSSDLFPTYLWKLPTGSLLKVHSRILPGILLDIPLKTLYDIIFLIFPKVPLGVLPEMSQKLLPKVPSKIYLKRSADILPETSLVTISISKSSFPE